MSLLENKSEISSSVIIFNALMMYGNVVPANIAPTPANATFSISSRSEHEGVSKMYPSYNSVAEPKECCIPASAIQVGNYSAEVGLQDLLNHTTKRIMEVTNAFHPNSKLLLISKVGFDGSTGQSVYKQKTEVCTRKDVSVEESLFLTGLAPL